MLPKYDENVFFRVRSVTPRNICSTQYDFTKHYNVETPQAPVINNDTFKSVITFDDGGQAKYEQKKLQQ